MSMVTLWNSIRRVTLAVAVGIGLLAAGGLAATAQAPQRAAADDGIVGIAIGLTADRVGAPARLVVERVLPNGPARAAGLRRGEEIVAINGRTVNGMSLRDVVHTVRGKVGTVVTLTLSEKGAKRDVALTRVEPPQRSKPRPRQPAQ